MKGTIMVETIAPRLLSRRDTAKYLGIGLNAVDKLKIPRLRLSEKRFAYDVRDIDAWIEARKSEAEEARGD